MKHYLKQVPIVAFLLMAFLAACTATEATELETSQTDRAAITVYRSPT